MTTTILIIVNVFAALAIIVLALMQQSKGDMGSAFGGGGSQSMFGSRGSANFLSRMTSTMCVVFFVSSLSLAYIYAQRADNASVVSGGDSVLDQVQTIESEVPSLDTGTSDVPAVEEAQNQIESEVPSLDVPSDDAVEEAVEDIPAETETN